MTANPESVGWTAALADVAAERRRQIEQEGWTAEHDDEHENGEIAMAAACYAAPTSIRCEWDVPCGCREAICPHGPFGRTEWRSAWPWNEQWWKPRSPRENLVRAGALILAEIERIDRIEGTQP